MPFVRISLKGSRSEKERQSIGDCVHRAKKALFKNIAEFLAGEHGVRPEDVFINLVETSMETWFRKWHLPVRGCTAATFSEVIAERCPVGTSDFAAKRLYRTAQGFSPGLCIVHNPA